MDLTNVSPDRREVLEKIALYEREERFDEDVENDPPTIVLTPDKVDYLRKKPWSKVKTSFANFVADHYFSHLIKKGVILTEPAEGTEHLRALADGAIVTCNHFSPYDNYIVYRGIKDALPKKRLYKVIREGNYTSFPGLYGFFFKNCDTLPLSSNMRTMMNMLSAVNTLLKERNTILIYPEQGMWWNYRKPRPFKSGGFKMAFRAKVPVVPMFITMKDGGRLGPDGYPIQIHTLHVMKAVYPELSRSEKEGVELMKKQAFEECKAKYEEVYGMPLVYHSEEGSEE